MHRRSHLFSISIKVGKVLKRHGQHVPLTNGLSLMLTFTPIIFLFLLKKKGRQGSLMYVNTMPTNLGQPIETFENSFENSSKEQGGR